MRLRWAGVPFTRVGAMTLTRVGAILLTMVGAVAVARVGAQAPAAPAFEVASVKPNHSGLPDEHFGLQPGGRFTATNVRARELIRSAFGVSDVQIVDAPGWTGSERFDVVAKAPGNPAPADVFLMLRSFLAERFHLVVHREQREMRVYALVKAGETLGPRLRPAAADCVAIMAGVRRGQQPPASSQTLCGTRGHAGHLEEGGRTMPQIAESLWPVLGTVVVDRTGLTGAYDLDLDFAPELAAATPGSPSSDAPSIFTAVHEQLGLKLDATKAPVDVLVVDRIDHPTPD